MKRKILKKKKEKSLIKKRERILQAIQIDPIGIFMLNIFVNELIILVS